MQDAPPLQQKPSLWQPIAGTLGLTALAALAARLAAPYLDASSLALFFVAPIVVLAIRFRLWAPITAAVLSTAALNYLFVEPRYTFVVARPRDGAALALFAVVAIMVSALAARARARMRSGRGCARGKQASCVILRAGSAGRATKAQSCRPSSMPRQGLGGRQRP